MEDFLKKMNLETSFEAQNNLWAKERLHCDFQKQTACMKQEALRRKMRWLD